MFGKLKCGNCGTTNDKKSEYCSQCGNVLAKAMCNACGAEISSNQAFCPGCGSKLNQLDGARKSQENVVTQDNEKIKIWSRGPLDFAKRIEVTDIKGTFKKNITVEQGTRALFLQGGRFTGELIPGTYNVGGLIKTIENLNFSEKAIVILTDNSDVRININVSGLRTSENLNAGVRSTIVLNLNDGILFFNNVMKGRANVALPDIEDYLRNEILNILQPKIKSYSFDALYGNNELKTEIQQDLQYNLQTTLERSGLKIIHLPYFDYDESEWTDINEQKSKIGKESANLKLDNLSEDNKDGKLELDKRARARDTFDSINELQNKDDIADAIHDSGISEIVRGHETESAKKIFENERDDRRRDRDRQIADDDQKHSQKLHIDKIIHEGETNKQRTIDQVDSKGVEAAFEDERTKKEMELDRLEAEQGMDLMSKMHDVNIKKVADNQNLELEKLKFESDIEAQKLQARSNASDEALLSVTDGPQSSQLSELAKMKAAQGLSEEQLMALSAKDSAGVAEALKVKYSNENTKKLYEDRLDDQSKFLDKLEQMSDKNADRAERMAVKSMEQMGTTAATRASVPSNTTVVPSGGGYGQPVVVGGQTAQIQKEVEKIIMCRECNSEVPVGTKFCTKCGGQI